MEMCHIGSGTSSLLHNTLPPLSISQQPIGALTVVPVCVDSLACAQIFVVSNAGDGYPSTDCGIYSRLQSNAELVEPIWGLKKTTVQLHGGEF